MQNVKIELKDVAHAEMFPKFTKLKDKKKQHDGNLLFLAKSLLESGIEDVTLNYDYCLEHYGIDDSPVLQLKHPHIKKTKYILIDWDSIENIFICPHLGVESDDVNIVVEQVITWISE